MLQLRMTWLVVPCAWPHIRSLHQQHAQHSACNHHRCSCVSVRRGMHACQLGGCVCEVGSGVLGTSYPVAQICALFPRKRTGQRKASASAHRRVHKMPLIRRAAASLLGSWAPATNAMMELTRQMGTERRPGLSGAWKQSMCLAFAAHDRRWLYLSFDASPAQWTVTRLQRTGTTILLTRSPPRILQRVSC
jgi:hypothetical protein